MSQLSSSLPSSEGAGGGDCDGAGDLGGDDEHGGEAKHGGDGEEGGDGERDGDNDGSDGTASDGGYDDERRPPSHQGFFPAFALGRDTTRG